MGLCTLDFCKMPACHGFMKAELRISVKDYRKNKNLKILLFRTPFAPRQYFVRMNGAAWHKDRPAVSLTRLLSGVPKALVRTG
jgi:hypothetical protein